ncbi:MAG: YicC family protein [Candidatus Zixiibacteriota bacterium]|nr:MAG: YicC family protein [candidate division Zixibacteria bacterium]
MNSMTGFGKAELKTRLGRFTVEISSVNNRFLEISQRLPRQFFTLEPKIRDLISSRLSRGKISVYVGFDGNDGSAEQFYINNIAIKAYYRQLRAIKKELKVDGEITIHDLLLLPEVARPDEAGLDEAVIWRELKRVMVKALDDLLAMRRKEGKVMAGDMKKRMSMLTRQTKQVIKSAPRAVEFYREKITRRLNELLDAPVPDNLRIEEQIALMAEKTDISEECTRFLSHIQQFSEALRSHQPAGKRLNFILQEMNREANTISSKSTDADISSLVISMKEQIEKVRELVQNVE